MTIRTMSLVCGATAVLLVPYPGYGQASTESTNPEPPPTADGSTWSLLRVAKWSTLTASTAAAGLGFVSHTRAQRRQTELEDACGATPSRCTPDADGGPYPDSELEQLRGEVNSLDRRTRLALTASQIGAAVTVLLFVFDLGGDDPPPNVIYDPQALQLLPREDGGVELRATIPLGR